MGRDRVDARFPVVGERLHRDVTLEDSGLELVYRGEQVWVQFNWGRLGRPDVRSLLAELNQKLADA
ncbi:MAG: hypothetical protein AAF328_06110 [Planctomycetota bacterium]